VIPRRNGQLRQRSTAPQSDRQRSEDSLQCQITPNCRVHQKDRSFQCQQLQTPTVGWRGTHRTVNSGVRCAHRQSSQPMTRIVVGDINISQPPAFKPSKHLTLFIQYKSKEYTPKDTFKAIWSSPSSIIKSSDQKCLVTWERVICVSFVALVAWLLSSFLSNLSKWFVKLARDT
jgi:hypothetical protein